MAYGIFHEPRLSYGEFLKIEMERAGVTVAELSERSGVSKQAIVFYRNNRRDPMRESIIAIARGLNRPVAAFFAFSSPSTD